MGAPLYDEKIDVWAAGCIIAEMILGRPIFLASSEIALLFTIFKLLGTPTLKSYPGMNNLKDLSSKYPKFHG
jgi:serine/threonine protein kinase